MFLHTVSVHVVIAGVTSAIAVSVPLVRVLGQATVVTSVTVAVVVAVFLVQIGL